MNPYMDPQNPVDPCTPPSKPRKVRFPPKCPPKRDPKRIPDRKDNAPADDADADEKVTLDLRRRFSEQLERQRTRVEKKTPVQVAFTHGVPSSSVRSFDKISEGGGASSEPNGGVDESSCDLGLNTTTIEHEQSIIELSSTAGVERNIVSNLVTSDAASKKKKKKYRDLWDYDTDPPITLPCMKPGSAEQLNETEYGADATMLEYNENTINAVSELGLLEENEDMQLLFFQFPPNFSLFKRLESMEGKETFSSMDMTAGRNASVSSNGKGVAGRSLPSDKSAASGVMPPKNPSDLSNEKGKAMVSCSASLAKEIRPKQAFSLDELPAGSMGKLLVYKSGAIKLKLGECLYDVSPGCERLSAEHVAVINTTDKDCCVVGELRKHAVVTPNVDSVLNSIGRLN